MVGQAEGEKPGRRKYIKFWLIGVAVLAVVWILGTLIGPPPEETTSASSKVAAVVQRPLGLTAQQARYEACTSRLRHYRELGVWRNGGVRPGVSRASWEQLTDAERQEVFDIAACIASAGQTTEKFVTVVEEGKGPEIETRRVQNDRRFDKPEGSGK